MTCKGGRTCCEVKYRECRLLAECFGRRSALVFYKDMPRAITNLQIEVKDVHMISLEDENTFTTS
jgi:hypothetical protein